MSYLDNLQEVEYERQIGDIDDIIIDCLHEAFTEWLFSIGKTEREADTIVISPRMEWRFIKGMKKYENLLDRYVQETLYNITGTTDEYDAWNWRINDLIREWEESKE